MKIQNPKNFKDGKSEINILKRIPQHKNLLTLKNYFTIEKNNKRYIYSIFDICCENLDTLIRKGDYKEGIPLDTVKKIFKQIISGLYTLHIKCKLIHCDIKTDNILLKGINNINKKIINDYKEQNFKNTFNSRKCKIWLESGKDISSIKKMKVDKKNKIKYQVHNDILKSLNLVYTNEDKYKNIDSKYLYNPEIAIADFGAACIDDEYYDGDFGTRYYRAPEIILEGNFSNKVDIWAVGCVLYELVTGEFLFDPKKDRNNSRDYYHLSEIIDLLGNFEIETLKSTKKWKTYFNKSGRLINKSDNTSNKFNKLYKNIKDENEYNQLIKLLKNMLEKDWKKRFSIHDIINDQWFKKI